MSTPVQSPLTQPRVLDGTAEQWGVAKPGNLAEAAGQFEALLTAQLLRSARSEAAGWLGTGEDSTASSAIEMAEQCFAQALSANGGLGLASMITRSVGDTARGPATKV